MRRLGWKETGQIKQLRGRKHSEEERENNSSPSEGFVTGPAASDSRSDDDKPEQRQLAVVLCCLLGCQDERSEAGERLRHLQELVLGDRNIHLK